PFVRAFAILSLQGLGYRVIAVTDGREALRRLAQEADIDLLFTDIVMPGGITGWELADRAREMRPGIKVLLTSGYAMETLAARGRINPDYAVLNKPYRKSELALRLRQILVQ
ncbi:MAG: response regulator, partial [Rhodospirillaceae bacterium]|nr:response regulator [Rhodospirillaceae bacterium]